MKTQKHKIFIISGPSGVGKTSIARGVVRKISWLRTAVTYTTRPERTRQKEDKKICYVNEEEFKKKIKKRDFLEWAFAHGYYYGTDKKQAEGALKKNHLVLNIEIQGAGQIKKKIPSTVLIFIKPDSFEILKKRIKKRGKMSHKDFKTRIEGAKHELKEATKYNYTIFNREGQLKKAIQEVCEIIKKESKL